ncbi:MAG TPA: hypothetical protein VJ983_02665 [candidate division Zixibacteria bacterium]|nr:hypothetical protein [candidate division Zixibacteria bacterium]
MLSTSGSRQIAVAIVGFIFAGMYLWPIPYKDVSMGGGFLLGWLIAAAIAGCLSRLFLRQSIILTASLISVGFAAATMARVIVDCSVDPTNHNLWPFEIGFAVFVGWPGGLIGALTAWKVKPVNS